MEDLYNYIHPINKERSPMISKETYEVIMKNAEVQSWHHVRLASSNHCSSSPPSG